MVEATIRRMNIQDLAHNSYLEENFDIGLWAAGYEARSSWLVESEYKPPNVEHWYRVEFEEHRDAHHAAHSLEVDLGTLLGGKSGRRYWDGYWKDKWLQLLKTEFEKLDRKLKIFIDYSSMTRTVYGTLLIVALRDLPNYVESITAVYVPGKYLQSHDGARRLLGLRSLIGTEGLREEYERGAAFVLGLGFDGVLTDAVIELYQVEHFSCLLAEPGVTEDAGAKAREINKHVLSRSELTIAAPVNSIVHSFYAIKKLCNWYLDRRPVILLPLGPKTQVLASILVATENPDIAFRWITTSWERPVDVVVPNETRPIATLISPDD